MTKLKGPWKAIFLVNLIGVNLAATMLGGFWLGRVIDRWLGSDPVFLIIGILIGLVAGIFSIIKLINPFIGES